MNAMPVAISGCLCVGRCVPPVVVIRCSEKEDVICNHHKTKDPSRIGLGNATRAGEIDFPGRSCVPPFT